MSSEIKLSKAEAEMCAFSPIEIFLYYIYYPKQLLRDAGDMNIDPNNLLLKTWNTANEYWYKKNSN